LVVSSKRKLASITLLSIIAPISLLALFRITEVLPEPATETILADIVIWSYSRPSRDFVIEETIKSIYQNAQVSVEVGTLVSRYFENAPELPFDYRDGITFRVTINIDGIQGFSSFILKFRPNDTNATLYVNKTFLVAYNATVRDMQQIGTDVTEAFIKVRPSSSLSGLDAHVYWVFDDENFENHQLRVSLEVIYSEGSILRKMVLPILLDVNA